MKNSALRIESKEPHAQKTKLPDLLKFKARSYMWPCELFRCVFTEKSYSCSIQGQHVVVRAAKLPGSFTSSINHFDSLREKPE